MCASWFPRELPVTSATTRTPGTFAGWARRLLALAALLIGVPVFAQSAVIGAGSPATLNQGNLRQATVSVTLTAGATYAAEADTSHFALTTAVPGLTVHSVAFNSGRTVATLRLHYDGSDFDAAATIAVTVAAAGTSHNAALTTGTRGDLPGALGQRLEEDRPPSPRAAAPAPTRSSWKARPPATSQSPSPATTPR